MVRTYAIAVLESNLGPLFETNLLPSNQWNQISNIIICKVE